MHRLAFSTSVLLRKRSVSRKGWSCGKFSFTYICRIGSSPLSFSVCSSTSQCRMSSEIRATEICASKQDTPSWQNLSKLPAAEDFVNGPNCSTPTCERESVRLFGQSQDDLRLVLYRDHASWCPYCHKVQMLIEAKRIPYTIKKVNMSCYGSKPEEFLKLVPTGLLPVIQLDGVIVTESMDIMFLLEETFQAPHRRLIPTDDNHKMQAFHRYMRLERVFTGAWLSCLRGPQALTKKGTEAVLQVLDMLEKCLGEYPGPFFYSDIQPTFIDINFATIFERSRSALRYWRNLEVTEGRPNLERWFEAWEQWGPAVYLRSDDWTHIGALPPQIGPIRFFHSRSDISLNIDIERSLHVLSEGLDGKSARDQAGAALCRNHELVVKDAIMGVEVPAQDHAHVETVFRVMTHVLLDPEAQGVSELRIRKQIPRSSWGIVGNALRFERSRCCAPRDMSILAMRQFCGAVNWALRSLRQDL
eukprot:GFKZ01008266.1.p1 GENE.GFKZ01008266.1~~GFKZ01008266.1.p1  ORF type:complete len:473 (+),score=28.39 GFKZ01008266.1:221-1639(+)